MAEGTDNISRIINDASTGPTHPLITPVENVFDSLGMMNGSMSPVYRAALGFALGSGAVYAVRPSFMFNQDGSPRPWSYVRNQPGVSTALPWWAPGAALAIGFGLFI